MTVQTKTAKDELQSYATRFEHLEDEITGLRSDQKDLMDEAASRGFDKAALRTVIRERKLRAKLGDTEYFQREAVTETYREVLGLIPTAIQDSEPAPKSKKKEPEAEPEQELPPLPEIFRDDAA